MKKIVKYLVEHGADVKKTIVNGWTPLFFAFDHQNKQLIKLLVEYGTDINKENKIFKQA